MSDLKNIVIVGNTLEGSLCALTLAIKLKSVPVRLTLCPAGSGDTADAHYAAGAEDSIRFLSGLGLSVPRLVGECGATFSLGTCYTGFASMSGEQRFKPFGGIGLDWGGSQFHHHWRRARPQYPVEDYFSFSPGVRAMRENRFAPVDPRNTIDGLHHQESVNFDVAKTTDVLRQRALDAGVMLGRHAPKEIKTDPESGYVRELQTDSGDILPVDLMIDCSGLEPCDPLDAIRGLSAENADVIRANTTDVSHDTGPIPPYARIEANGQSVTISTPNDSAVINLQIDDPDRWLTRCCDAYQGPWQRNILSIGVSGAPLPPFDSLPWRFLERDLGRLISLLPPALPLGAERAEYNRLHGQDFAEALDLVSLHLVGRKTETGHVAEALSSSRHATLKSRLDLFSKRGWIWRSDTDLISADEWAASFLLHGLNPHSSDPIAQNLPLETLQQELDGLQARLQKTVGEFPPHDKYLAAVKRARASEDVR